ncbi:MAG: pentapeptide repeat-containing protein [Pseudomonadota bacterium]
MSDLSPVSPALIEEEAPVNPYSLLEAVNTSSDSAHTSWLIFLGLMSYLLIAVAGVSHKDLLLNNDIALPILQVKIELARFFLFAPLVILMFHLGVIIQLVMLARKSIEFDAAIRLLEVSNRRSHPLRLELNNFFFVQAIAGPRRSRIMAIFLHTMTWLSLALIPVLLIVYIQVMFLPYHDVFITWSHRVALVADAAMLILIGVFLVRAETSFFSAFVRTGAQNPVSFFITTVVLTAVTFFSFFIATVPGEFMARASERVMGINKLVAAGSKRDDYVIGGFVVPFFGASADGSLFGIFHRNLNVTDLDLVVDKDVTPGEPTIILRGRDLRYAKLDRTDLHQADFTGADLQGASLRGADLRNAWLQCANLNALLLGNEETKRRDGQCSSARKADFSKARLSGARMVGIDLTKAKLEEANLTGADLSHAAMSRANFSSAQLAGAKLRGGAGLQGANFFLAAMQGIDLTGANLQGADLSNARAHGAILKLANLESANLLDAEFNGADLRKARFRGADLSGAVFTGADLSEAVFWQTVPPAAEAFEMAKLAGAALKPLSEGERARQIRMLALVGDDEITQALARIMDPAISAGWAQSEERARWAELMAGANASRAPSYRSDVSRLLVTMMCDPRWRRGYVARGIVGQATSDDFRGLRAAIYRRVAGSVTLCAAAGKVPESLLAKLASKLDTSVLATGSVVPSGGASTIRNPGKPLAPASQSARPGRDVPTLTQPPQPVRP